MYPCAVAAWFASWCDGSYTLTSTLDSMGWYQDNRRSTYVCSGHKHHDADGCHAWPGWKEVGRRRTRKPPTFTSLKTRTAAETHRGLSLFPGFCDHHLRHIKGRSHRRDASTQQLRLLPPSANTTGPSILEQPPHPTAPPPYSAFPSTIQKKSTPLHFFHIQKYLCPEVLAQFHQQPPFININLLSRLSLSLTSRPSYKPACPSLIIGVQTAQIGQVRLEIEYGLHCMGGCQPTS